MKLVKFFSNRITIVTLAIIAQLAAIVAASHHFEGMGDSINVALKIMGFFVVCVVINGKSDVSIKLTWIVFILVTPVFGSIMYLLTGGKPPRKKMRTALAEAEKSNRKFNPKNENAEDTLKENNPDLYAQSRYLSNFGFNVLTAESAEYFSSGEEAFPVMLREAEKAEKFIFMEYFIMSEGKMLDSIMDVLERKAKEGVEVRIIYDDVGSLFSLPDDFCEKTEKKGIKCMAFNPFVPFLSGVMNNRNHRKMMVIDSRVAFSGGINIADEYINVKERFGYWKDNVFMVSGQGAEKYALMFLDMWKAFRDKTEDVSRFMNESENLKKEIFLQPFCDTPLDDDSVGEDVYLNAINGAKNYIYIFTPYLVLGQKLAAALCLASKRGVDVRVLVPGIPDKKTVYTITRSHYEPLIKAGVKIYEFTPGFLHSKGFVSDDVFSCCGTINLDFRSLQHHFECGCLFFDGEFAKKVKLDVTETMERSKLITKYRRRGGILGSTYSALLRLISPLM